MPSTGQPNARSSDGGASPGGASHGGATDGAAPRPEAVAAANLALRVSGKNMDIGEALRARAEAAVAAAVGKYAGPREVRGHLTVERDGAGYRAECVVHLPDGLTLTSSGSAMEAPGAVDEAATHVAKQMRRHKRERVGARNDPRAAVLPD